MIYTKEMFEAFNPLHYVVVEVDCVARSKTNNGLLIINNTNSQNQFATHKGLVVKEPIVKTYPAETEGMMRHGTDYLINVGDTVYFGYDVINVAKDPSSPRFIEYSENGLESEISKYYIAIDYRELILCETKTETFGLNGFCAGYHPKIEGRLSSDLIYIPSKEWEKEIVDAVSMKKGSEITSIDKERLVVMYAPKGYCEYGFNELIHTTEVCVGDVVMFPPNSFCVALSNKLIDNQELFAINVREICAYAVKV